MSAKDLPSPELLRQLLRYEPETGKLYWRTRTPDMFNKGKRSVEHSCNQWNSRYAGQEAFTADNGQGYKQGCLLGKPYKAHRIIWAIVNGEWIDEVDHVTGVRSDNRIANLRDGSNGENRKNLRLPLVNTSGVMGVSWFKKIKKWHSYINADGQRIRLGYFENFDDAVSARKSAEVKYGYHKNHGR